MNTMQHAFERDEQSFSDRTTLYQIWEYLDKKYRLDEESSDKQSSSSVSQTEH